MTFDPKCLDKRQEVFAINNRMELMPCCWVDPASHKAEPELLALMAVSKISDYDSIEEILLTDEWVQFVKDLRQGKGLKKCHETCKAGSIKIVQKVSGIDGMPLRKWES